MSAKPIQMVTMYQDKHLSECSNGEIVNALREIGINSRMIQRDVWRAVTDEAQKRKILPEAMWLVQGK